MHLIELLMSLTDNRQQALVSFPMGNSWNFDCRQTTLLSGSSYALKGMFDIDFVVLLQGKW